jgi:hypothetical protein
MDDVLALGLEGAGANQDFKSRFRAQARHARR